MLLMKVCLYVSNNSRNSSGFLMKSMSEIICNGFIQTSGLNYANFLLVLWVQSFLTKWTPLLMLLLVNVLTSIGD